MLRALKLSGSAGSNVQSLAVNEYNLCMCVYVCDVRGRHSNCAFDLCRSMLQPASAVSTSQNLHMQHQICKFVQGLLHSPRSVTFGPISFSFAIFVQEHGHMACVQTLRDPMGICFPVCLSRGYTSPLSIWLCSLQSKQAASRGTGSLGEEQSVLFLTGQDTPVVLTPPLQSFWNLLAAGWYSHHMKRWKRCLRSCRYRYTTRGGRVLILVLHFCPCLFLLLRLSFSDYFIRMNPTTNCEKLVSPFFRPLILSFPLFF